MKSHPSSIIHPKARIACSVTVGPYAVIGEDVEIGDDCEVMAHGVFAGPSIIGRKNRFFPFVSIGQDPQDLKYRGERTSLEIGDSNTFREYVTVNRGTVGAGGVTRIGHHNLLMTSVHIAHDCQLGSHIVMANGASLAGHVEIGDYAIVGAFCGVHQFTRIGAYCFLGAFTGINKDILPYMRTTADRPMNVLGPNKLGLERSAIPREDIEELDRAFRILSRSKLNTAQALAAIEAQEFKSVHVKALVDFIRTSQRGVAK
jgi:UDP-N-acetylglucosamine acyltransferase